MKRNINTKGHAKFSQGVIGFDDGSEKQHFPCCLGHSVHIFRGIDIALLPGGFRFHVG